MRCASLVVVVVVVDDEDDEDDGCGGDDGVDCACRPWARFLPVREKMEIVAFRLHGELND